MLKFVCFLLVSFAEVKANDVGPSLCCRRLPRYVSAGFDPSAHPIRLDVGRCSATCGETAGAAENENRYVSVLERLQQNKDVALEPQACMLSGSDDVIEARCEPSLTHEVTLTTNLGPKSYDVIDRCVCRNVAKKCERLRKLKRFFVGTEFEATIDVGQCAGGCRRGSRSCRPIRTNSKAIMGPNGLLSVQTISECRCEKSCYREHFNVAVTEKIVDRKTGDVKLSTKLIDVGKCTGTCGPIERCVLRAEKKQRHKRPTKCLMALQTHDVKCSPVRMRDVTYTNRHGETEHISQIRRCGCT